MNEEERKKALKEVREELKMICDERRQSKKEYRYWKVREDRLKIGK